ncbi:MAG: protein TolB [Desulfobulbus propionicus]|nr:MAG: protein TolB [Desulfobulbus propionicus]
MKRFVRRFFSCLLTGMALLGLAGQVQAERVYLDVTASDVRKIVIAVPDFTGNGAIGRQAADLLSKALELHGFIEVLDPQRYGRVKEANWKGLGVDYVIMGQFSTTGDRLSLEGQPLDVAENRLLGGRRYSGSTRQQEEMVLKLCDGLIEEFTGEPGISRSAMAFISDATGKKEVYVSDILGLHPRQVTKHRHLCVSPRFTPDGHFLAYSSYHHGNQDLYITDLRQSKVTKLLSRYSGMNLAGAFTPDGQQMIVTLSKGGSPDLYLLDRKGKILRQLTSRSGINVSASCSPDGSKIVFVSDRSGKPQIYQMALKSGRTQRLTFENSENSEPSWSPKGDLIAYTGLVGGRYQIFTMGVDGRHRRQISSGWGDFESPTWSPDGKQLAFTRKRNGRSEICIANRNGKNFRVLFNLPGNQAYPQWSGRKP